MRIFVTFLILVMLSIKPLASAKDLTSISEVDLALEQKEFSGNVLVAFNGQVVFEKVYGFANREDAIPYNKATIFGIGSITKQFVATAILMLEEQGKLKVSDKLSSYFDNVPTDKKDITVHQLLTQSSGLTSLLPNEHLYGKVSYEEFPERALATKLLFAPGTDYNYSNLGYSLLARIIERVSGKNWETYIHTEVLEPAGLNSTGYRLLNFEPAQLAVNYGADPNVFQRFLGLTDKSRSVGSSLEHHLNDPGERWFEGAGGFLSTQEDMYRWYLAIRSKRILTADSWLRMHTPYVKENADGTWHYGYGWALTEQAGIQRIVHNGSNGYSFAEFNYYPEIDLFVFVSTNDVDNFPEVIIEKLYFAAIASYSSQAGTLSK